MLLKSFFIMFNILLFHYIFDISCFKALQQMNGMQTQAQRFARLQHLLTRSNIYAQFLLKKMEEQRKAEQKAEEKQQQKQKKETDEHEKKGKDSQKTKAKDKVGNSQVRMFALKKEFLVI